MQKLGAQALTPSLAPGHECPHPITTIVELAQHLILELVILLLQF